MDHLHSTLKISLAQTSERGPKPENQDTIGARIPEGSALVLKGIAVAIADGVSSSSAAKQASQSAVTGFLTDYYATPDTWGTQKSATQVIQSLNRYLWGQSRNSVAEEGYLTTFSSIVLKGDKCFVFHVGDSRVYRLRDNNLECLTRDHTQKIDKTTSYLSRALGADPSLEIDIHSEEIQVGDIYILTTDGIHDAIPRAEFKQICRSADTMETLIQSATEAAKRHASHDNISIQAFKIEALGTASQRDAVTVLSKLPFPPALEVGQSLDGLTVERILHESERSQVYLVKDTKGCQFVMKTPSANYDDDLPYIERFVMESWVGTRIQNPQVVRVITPPQERQFLYYLTEHIKGQTLGDVIRERAPIDVHDAIQLTEYLVKGLRGFHRKDTLHQDLKPENIVIGPRGPTIIDFGSCWVMGVKEAGSPFANNDMLGTMSYSAPEYRYGGTVSTRSDQYSLAAILYEMLTNKQPYGEKYERAMSLKAFQRLKYRPAYKINPMVPIWLDNALRKALDIRPEARYSSLSEWLSDLKHPNPKWQQIEAAPLLERNPERVWQVIAGLGWMLALALLAEMFG
ncbi:MAG: serine/threonine protein kinase [Alteromonadaceae bacterium]|nr:MAG: serine/threonine protein kinase [Alteromonadaceae bacterium]